MGVQLCGKIFREKFLNGYRKQALPLNSKGLTVVHG